MKTKNGKQYWIFDNGGTTIDRYTIITEDADVYGASTNPFHPQGFGQFSHNIADQKMNIAYGYAWRKHCNVKKIVKSEVKGFLSEARQIPSWIGKEVLASKKFTNELPENLIKFIEQITV